MYEQTAEIQRFSCLNSLRQVRRCPCYRDRIDEGANTYLNPNKYSQCLRRNSRLLVGDIDSVCRINDDPRLPDQKYRGPCMVVGGGLSVLRDIVAILVLWHKVECYSVCHQHNIPEQIFYRWKKKYTYLRLHRYVPKLLADRR